MKYISVGPLSLEKHLIQSRHIRRADTAEKRRQDKDSSHVQGDMNQSFQYACQIGDSRPTVRCLEPFFNCLVVSNHGLLCLLCSRLSSSLK